MQRSRSSQAWQTRKLDCGGAPGGAGPYVTGAARLQRQVGYGSDRGARADPLAKGLPVGCATHAPLWGLRKPWRLPALHPSRLRGTEKERAIPAPLKKTKARVVRSVPSPDYLTIDREMNYAMRGLAQSHKNVRSAGRRSPTCGRDVSIRDHVAAADMTRAVQRAVRCCLR